MGFLLPSNDAAMIASGVGIAASAIMSIFNEIRMNNVSANGCYVWLKTVDDNVNDCDPFPTGMFITKFSDDANAFTISPSNIYEAEPSFNGQLIVKRENPVVNVDISVIPFSADAENLDNAYRKVMSDPSIEFYMNIAYIRPNKNAMVAWGGTFADKTETKYLSLTGGRMIEGAANASVSQYRLDARKYSFVFSGVGSPTDIGPTTQTLSGTWSL